MLGRWGWPKGIEAGPGRADALLAAIVVAIVGTMIVPLPTAVLDVLLASNLAIAILLILVAVYLPKGLAFTAFPTVLLVTTLYRLALNVSSTRLILLDADAGRVIQSFGDFVVQGNYAVGAIVFFVLTLIQLVVITKGAERVAEVGARFTLDAMPGKQMAIDAELRAGTIDGGEAGQRRRTLETESQFYGAMDGAMKFVKGDAIAGIAITCVNVAGGFGLGVLDHGMGPMEALETFALLAIGDGLVSQLPALLISTSAGLVVTRVASNRGTSLSTDLGHQVFGNGRALFLASAFLAVLSLVPGLPFVPFALLAAVFAGTAEVDRRRRHASTLDSKWTTRPSSSRTFAATPLSLELGSALADGLTSSHATWSERWSSLREEVFRDLGIALPSPTITRDESLSAWSYRIGLLEVPVSEGSCRDLDDALVTLPAAFRSTLRVHAKELVGIQEVQDMLDPLTATHPALVRSVVPKPISVPVLRDVLRHLLDEGLSIRPLREILEVLSTVTGREASNPASLAETVRRSLRRSISHRFAPGGVLAALTLEPEVEEAFRDGIVGKDAELHLALPPDLGREILEAIRSALEAKDPEVVLLVRADVRRFVRSFLRDELPLLPVLCAMELDPNVRIRSVGRVGMTAAPSPARRAAVPA